MATSTRSDWGFELSAIQVPVRFWHGKRDRNIPWTYAAKVAAMIPNSTTHWTEDDGHYSLPVLPGAGDRINGSEPET